MAATMQSLRASLGARSSRAVFGGKVALRGAPLRAAIKLTGNGSRKLTVMKAETDQVGAAYANALVDLAKETNALEAIHADMDAFQSVLKENADIMEFLANPVVAEGKKKEMLASIAKEAGFNANTTNFLCLLLDCNRFDAIESIFESFEDTYCRLTDTQVATLRSAVKLEQEQQFLIAKKLQELTGSKNIKLKPVIDASLIAGFVVEYGSSQIDLSVKGQLDKISAELEAAATTAV